MSYSLFFINKEELLITVTGIYNNLIDITSELTITKEALDRLILATDVIQKHVHHLRHMLIKDLTIHDNDTSDLFNVKKVEMTVQEWNQFINESSSDDDDEHTLDISNKK
jgi:hypothetical protein